MASFEFWYALTFRSKIVRKPSLLMWVRQRFLGSSGGLKSESAGAAIEGNVGETGIPETDGEVGGLHRNKGTVNVNQAMEPSIGDFKSEKLSAGTEHTVNFGERAILHFAGAQMMQDANSDGGGEGTVRKWQRGGITLHDRAGAGAICMSDSGREVMAVFQAGHAQDAPTQFQGRGSSARADFQKMIAEIIVAQQPG
jgi:hypothetical protein